MGNDASLFCIECKQKEHIGRAYRYSKENMNQKILEDLHQKIKVAIARFEMSLVQTGLFNEDYQLDIGFFNEITYFLEIHKGHEIWLIDDYFGEK